MAPTVTGPADGILCLWEERGNMFGFLYMTWQVIQEPLINETTGQQHIWEAQQLVDYKRLKWRSFSFAILSCIYNCMNRVWHKNNCQPALDGQLGSSLFSKKAPTHQLNCPLSSKVAKPWQTYMPNTDRLHKSSSVKLDGNLLCLRTSDPQQIVDKPIFPQRTNTILAILWL